MRCSEHVLDLSTRRNRKRASWFLGSTRLAASITSKRRICVFSQMIARDTLPKLLQLQRHGAKDLMAVHNRD